MSPSLNRLRPRPGRPASRRATPTASGIPGAPAETDIAPEQKKPSVGGHPADLVFSLQPIGRLVVPAHTCTEGGPGSAAASDGPGWVSAAWRRAPARLTRRLRRPARLPQIPWPTTQPPGPCPEAPRHIAVPHTPQAPARLPRRPFRQSASIASAPSDLRESIPHRRSRRFLMETFAGRPHH